MTINPINVIQLLLLSFQAMNIQESPITKDEIALKDNIEKLLLDCINNFEDPEFIVESTLAFQEPFKDTEMHIVEDIDRIWSADVDEHGLVCTADTEDLSWDYKRKAVDYWRSGVTKNLALQTVQHRFRKVQSITQLRRWAHTLNKGGTYKEKIGRINKFVLDNFQSASDAGYIIHDRDLQKWALQAQKIVGHEDIRFKASRHWLQNFKKAHRIVSRKINKFVTKKTVEGREYLQKAADDFVSDVKKIIKSKGLESIYNSDQSGFQIEMHSGRTLAIEGEKQIECLVESVSSTTHSYTIQPLISGDGRLLSPLFIVLKESKGTFGPVVESKLFKPSNIYVMPSASGKLTSEHFKTWLKDVYFPNVGHSSVLLIDSWSGHCPDAVKEAAPPNKIVDVKIIPKGTTGKIQPLDAFGFRVWKNYVRRFEDSVTLMNEDIELHKRNNIIKLQSLVHNQLSSPRYNNLFKYSWYKSGYVESKPNEFYNPVDFSFGNDCNERCEVPGCSNPAIVRCSWCKKSLCLKHFFNDYHYCQDYKK